MKRTYLILAILVLCFNITNAQTNRFEVQLGSGFWVHNNKQKMPEKQYNVYLNENIKLGYKLLEYLSVGISTNYTLKKHYSKMKHIILPNDELLFDKCTIKERNLEFGPYLKFSIGHNFILSFSMEYNYSIGNSISDIVTENLHRNVYISNGTRFKSSLSFFELSIGKRIVEQLYINTFIRRRHVFTKKYETDFGETDSQNYFGIQLNYFFNL